MDVPQAWPPRWFDPDRYAVLTPDNVKALAHPIRMSLLRLLREDGPATASQFLRTSAQVAYERALRYLETLAGRRDELHQLPWTLGDVALNLTCAEGRELAEQIMEVVARLRRDQAGPACGPGGPDVHQAPGEPERHRAVLQFQLMPDEHRAPESTG